MTLLWDRSVSYRFHSRQKTYSIGSEAWIAKKKVEKVNGRIVPVRDPKTVEVLELRVGYVISRGLEAASPDLLVSGVTKR